MYRPRHTHSFCRQFRKPTPFLESTFGQVFLGALVTFVSALLAGVIFFSV